MTRIPYSITETSYGGRAAEVAEILNAPTDDLLMLEDPRVPDGVVDPWTADTTPTGLPVEVESAVEAWQGPDFNELLELVQKGPTLTRRAEPGLVQAVQWRIGASDHGQQLVFRAFGSKYLPSAPGVNLWERAKVRMGSRHDAKAQHAVLGRHRLGSLSLDAYKSENPIKLAAPDESGVRTVRVGTLQHVGHIEVSRAESTNNVLLDCYEERVRPYPLKGNAEDPQEWKRQAYSIIAAQVAASVAFCDAIPVSIADISVDGQFAEKI